MRIVFAIPYFYPAWQYGGTPRAAFEYAKSLVQRGHDVSVLTTDSIGDDRLTGCKDGECVDVDGVQVFYYRNISNRLAFKQRIFWPAAMFADLQKHLAHADVLHVHDLRSSVSVRACAV